jgi:hypothetical protein
METMPEPKPQWLLELARLMEEHSQVQKEQYLLWPEEYEPDDPKIISEFSALSNRGRELNARMAVIKEEHAEEIRRAEASATSYSWGEDKRPSSYGRQW